MESPRDRFFVEGRHAPNELIELAPDDARKIVTVLRMASGDRVLIVDSAAQQFVATIELAGVAVRARLAEAPLEGRAVESAREIALAQAIPKGQKMDFVVEKATELGIARLIPVRSARSIAGASPAKLTRWQKLAKSAAQQSGRTRVPQIEDAIDFDALVARIAGFDATLFAWELGGAALRATLEEMRAARSILLVIGPEGGFSHAEAEAATAAGATAVSLGARILRTETAALVVLTAILYEGGEL